MCNGKSCWSHWSTSVFFCSPSPCPVGSKLDMKLRVVKRWRAKVATSLQHAGDANSLQYTCLSRIKPHRVLTLHVRILSQRNSWCFQVIFLDQAQSARLDSETSPSLSIAQDFAKGVAGRVSAPDFFRVFLFSSVLSVSIFCVFCSFVQVPDFSFLCFSVFFLFAVLFLFFSTLLLFCFLPSHL